MNSLLKYFSSSIGKKQIVAVTGLILVLFLMGHLAGNFFIYGGPESFNSYAEHLANLRPALLVVEYSLGVFFLVHMLFTACIVVENVKSRAGQYAVKSSKGKKSLATRLMPYTGTILLIFVVTHLFDFTFSNHEGIRSVLSDGQSYGLYGVVFNSFKDPVHGLFYIVAMFCLSLHLSHGIESVFQTNGCSHPKYTPMIKAISHGFALFMALAYSSIPVFVFFADASVYLGKLH